MPVSIREFDCCGLGEVLLYDIDGATDLSKEIKLSHGSDKGAFFATTVTGDPFYIRMERLLKKAGFRYITRFKNPNSGSTLKFWLMIPKKRKSKYDW